MSKKKGYYYPDISTEFEIARINYGIRKQDGQKMLQKDFDPSVDPSMINNVAAGRLSNKALRERIEAFTTKWNPDYKPETTKSEE